MLTVRLTDEGKELVREYWENHDMKQRELNGKYKAEYIGTGDDGTDWFRVHSILNIYGKAFKLTGEYLMPLS